MIKEVIGNATLYCGDSNEILDSVDAVDSCVTDPPYGLSFMGKQWDYDVPNKELWRKVANSLKSGGHLLSFFGSRTYHRGVIPIEDAGFEIRDQLMWIYGSGFPKSLNIGKAADKLQGNEREVVGTEQIDVGMQSGSMHAGRKTKIETRDVTKGNSEWEGWGTALKPAHEPIVMARKPFKGSVAENVLEHGTGGINIDGCRVGTESLEYRTTSYRDAKTGEFSGQGQTNHTTGQKAVEGRFPANVMHDGSENVVRVFPDDNSRYFYCAKTSKQDRDEGLDGLLVRQSKGGGGLTSPKDEKGNYIVSGDKGTAGKYGSAKAPAKNFHPTVKPVELMKYLCRLVTPQGGVVLDPFMGSGSTGKGALLEGFKFVGIEMEREYFDIACARLEAVQNNIQQDLF
jgi:DNA modification methylase